MGNTVIQLKKSSTPGAQPLDLANGELAINFADGRIWYKNTTNQLAYFASNVGGIGGGPAYGTVNANGTLLVASVTNDILKVLPGNGITITGDAGTDTLTIAATGIVAAAGNAAAGNTLAGVFTSRTSGRGRFNFIPGQNITINVDDDSAGDRANVTITSTATGGGGSANTPRTINIPIPMANDNYTIFYTTKDLILTHIASVLSTVTPAAPPSVNTSIFFGANRAAGTPIVTNMITTNTFFANTNTVFSTASITANTFVWLNINAVTNNPTEYHVTLSFA